MKRADFKRFEATGICAGLASGFAKDLQ